MTFKTAEVIELELLRKKQQYAMFMVQFACVGQGMSKEDRAKFFEIAKAIHYSRTEEEAEAKYQDALDFVKKFS